MRCQSAFSHVNCHICPHGRLTHAWQFRRVMHGAPWLKISFRSGPEVARDRVRRFTLFALEVCHTIRMTCGSGPRVIDWVVLVLGARRARSLAVIEGHAEGFP
jgi:hypothetical protein